MTDQELVYLCSHVASAITMHDRDNVHNLKAKIEEYKGELDKSPFNNEIVQILGAVLYAVEILQHRQKRKKS